MGSRETSSLTLYFARHGESEANLLREFSNRGLKHGLTERGRRQAASLAAILRERRIARIFTSPLLRATQAAELVAGAIGAPVEIVDALREYDCGILEGRSDPISWARYASIEEDWLRHGRWASCVEGGESFLDMRQRFLPCVERLIQTYRSSGAGVLLIGHGGLYRCMLPLILTNIDADFARKNTIANTGCVIAELGPSGLTCTAWCDMELPSSSSEQGDSVRPRDLP
jgi:probable phosphoglycerate mutase